MIRVARAVFAPDRPFQGSTFLDSRERDGIFVGDDLVVIVEATTGRSLEKAKKDGAKLLQAVNTLSKQHRFKGVRGYFITKEEPTPDQRRHIESLSPQLVACNLAQLRSMLVDSRDYLTLRAEHPFGSARNPATGSVTELDQYIPITLLAAREGGSGAAMSVVDLVARCQNAGATLLLGDFGAGKSMTLREVHTKLAAAHFKDSSSPFPVTLNLREHQGQREPDEAIRRHANSLGFDNPAKLVRAWKAGNVHVLLDGFDEIATTGWQGRAAALAQIRRSSVELVRRFAELTPQNVGLVVSGRRHFFDTQEEALTSLGLRRRATEIAATDQFSEGQVRQYLESHGWAGSLPAWLPTHPLLLGYLATTGALQSMNEEESSTPHVGWDALLDRICDREAEIEVGLDGHRIRRVLERLATVARTRSDGTGPIYQKDLADAFEQICGYPPDEGSYQVLQRLPGLGVQDASEGTRFFIDTSLADAARAGDLTRYVIGGAAEDLALETIRGSAITQGRLGIGVGVVQAQRMNLVPAQVNAAAQRLQQHGASDALALDLIRVGVDLGSSAPPAMTFRDLDVDRFVFDDGTDDLGSLSFVGCVIATVDLTEYDGAAQLPFFDNCAIGTVEGAGSVDALPLAHFVDCTFDSFDPSSKTTRGILAMPGLSPRQKVLMTVLKKTYAQAGSGRRANALPRGMDDRMRQLVPDVLEMLTARGLLVRGKVGGNEMYFPVRGQSSRVRQIMEAGASSTDPLVLECK